MKTTNLPIYPMNPKIPNIAHSSFIGHIGKIEITENTPQRTIAVLMKANPRTLKINGKYV